jgi:hypothetical protein
MSKITIPDKATGDTYSATEWNVVKASINGAYDSVGYTSRPFNETLTFDANFTMEATQTANINFTLAASPVEHVLAEISIIGDGVHTCTFPDEWVNANGQLFDNRQQNVIKLEYMFGKVFYGIIIAIIPDVIAPYIVSAVIGNSIKNQIILTYSEELDETSVPATGAFSLNLSKAVTNVAIGGATITITTDSNYAYGDVPAISYTPAGTPVQDLAGNDAVALTAYAITNNISPARQSVSIANNSQILLSGLYPANLDYSGTDGITQKAISVCVWIKRSNTHQGVLFVIGASGDAPQLSGTLFADGKLSTTFYAAGGHGGSGYLSKTTTSGVSSGVWTQVVVTSDGTGFASGLKVYFNTALQAMSTDLNSYNAITSVDHSDFYLSWLGAASLAAKVENTLTASAYIFMKEMSQTEVNEIYNSGTLINPTTLSFASSLKARHEFNGDLLDTGGSGYDLTSTVAPTFTPDTP